MSSTASISTRKSCMCSTTRENISRCAGRSTSRGRSQGWPVIVQAGASDAGRQLAAETAEAVFTGLSDLAAGQSFYADVKGAHGEGRARPRPYEDPAGLLRSYVGDTPRRGAREARPSSTASCITTAPSPRSRSRWAMTPRGFDPDAPLPDIPESNASKSGRERADRAGAEAKT